MTHPRVLTPPLAWRRAVVAVVLAGLAPAAGCRPSIAIPTGMVVGGASLGYLGHELVDSDPTLGLAAGAIPGLLLGAGVGLVVGISHELRKAYREDD